jgi:glycosyltransferase 2 family protein
VATFAVLLYELGAGNVVSKLRSVGWGVLPIVAQELLIYAANTAAWRAAFPRPRPRLPFRLLLGARIAGDAINYLTPTATFGGEFVRGRMLAGHAPTTSVVASIAVAKLAQPVGLVVFLILGGLIVLPRSPLPVEVRRGLLTGVGVFALVLALLVLAQRWGVFRPLLELVSRTGARGGPLLADLVARLDRDISSVHRDGTGGFTLSAGCFALGFALGTVEAYLALWFLGLPATVDLALTIALLGQAGHALFFFVPLRAGSQEAINAAIFGLLGLGPAAGLALAIVYRMREIVWAAIGLGILQRHRRARAAFPPAEHSVANSQASHDRRLG